MPIAFATFLLLSALAFPQPPWGTLRVVITPKVIRPGDSVRFEAGEMSPGMCPYWATYTVQPIPPSEGDPDSFLVRVWADSNHRKCLSAGGFAGPDFHIVARDVGRYEIRFDSASVFKPDMGDSAVFRVVAPTAVSKQGTPVSASPQPRRWNVDGRLRSQASGIPGRAEN